MEFGVDEAGKGPVLGPMVAACVAAPTAALPADVDDSKRVAPARREEIAAQLTDDDRVRIGVAHVRPDRIDGDEDMNTLTVVAHATAIADADVTGAGLLDACDVDAARFARRVDRAVASRVDASLTLDAEHGADESSALVGAASIVAKVERDAVLADLRAEFGDVGSGYPSDSTTRTFLREYVRDHGDLPACARRSWKTSRDVLAAAEQSSLDAF